MGRPGKPPFYRNRGTLGRPSRWPSGAGRVPVLASQGDPGSSGAGATGRIGGRRRVRSDQRDTARAGRQERYRERISEAFGAHPQIVFKADPALIAGLELHGPHLVVSNSWRADLTQILADLTHDNRP